MKLLIDMNLSPSLCPILQEEGWDAIHWSQVGRPSAPDDEIIELALKENRVVLTHDLDFGTILAMAHAAGPSVVQVRTQDVRPQALAPILILLLRRYEQELDSGAIVTVDEARSRVRVLPLSKR
jgi:predicted nuclease of predicted toxin-antitoxin system